MIILIAAVDENNALGKQGQLLCHLPRDLKHFKKMTLHQTVLMGRKTFESIGHPLPQRENFILTRQKNLSIFGAICVRSLHEALEKKRGDDLWILGGGEIYRETFALADKIVLTKIHHRFKDADTFFPILDTHQWKIVSEEYHAAGPKNKFALSFISLIPANKL